MAQHGTADPSDGVVRLSRRQLEVRSDLAGLGALDKRRCDFPVANVGAAAQDPFAELPEFEIGVRGAPRRSGQEVERVPVLDRGTGGNRGVSGGRWGA